MFQFFPSDFRILVMVPEGPAALPDAILQMAFVFDSFRFSTWVFSDWSSRFQGNSTGDFHNALFLLSGLATVGLHYSWQVYLPRYPDCHIIFTW